MEDFDAIACPFDALDGLAGVLTIHDDILIFGEGSTVEEARTDHENNFHSLMRRCREQNIKLNQDKVNLRRKEVPFMGHVISEKGLQADPAKVKAVLEMPTPTDVASVRRFIGFTNYLSKFLPRLSDALFTIWKGFILTLTVKEVFVESDHKPLEVIFKKPLHRTPKRLQRMLMRVQLYNVSLGYKKGSTMYLADTLSRAY